MADNKPQRLVSYGELRQRTGIPYGTLRMWKARGKLPAPDYTVGQSPVWLPETIEPWILEHESALSEGPKHHENESPS